MKSFVVAGLVSLMGCVAVAAATAQTTKYGVSVTPEKNVDFKTLRNYTWRRGQPSSDKTIDAQITASIDRELSALGMTKVAPAQADVVLTYGSLRRTDVDLKGKTDSKGLLPEYPVGTLVVIFSDPKSDRRMLRMRVDLPIDIRAGQLEAAINHAVALMFAEYPTRRRR